ncbi:MAG: cytochrome c [Gammaproteobacteria bacterium]|nr:cytochrome c [Gammaproteobacteria bacterium]
MSSSRAIRLALPLFLVAATLSTTAVAQQPTKAEQMLKYRKALYTAMAWNFGPMGAMAQGKMPYNAADFALRAQRVAEIAPMLAESFGPETKGLPNSELKPEAWDNRADFDAKMKDLVDRSAALAQVAKSGDEAKAKAAFFDTANACKACHDKYKKKD